MTANTFRTRIEALLRAPAARVAHDEVLRHLEHDGAISARYCIMILLSCGIAILGLLQSSPAVVIGAMLISPLMTPIVLFGFSLAVLDLRIMTRSIRAIALGTALATAFSALIVWLSPLTVATPEILARTQPNLFDLLVAIFSAVAGAYAVVHRKGETIVGVAIATALMPPLAVMGYGLAIANIAIFLGSAGLFMTNLLAIGLTASLMARFFGFGSGLTRKTGNRHVLAIVAVFGVLSIPLATSLHHIAQEAIIGNKVRTMLNTYFTARQGRIFSMDVRFGSGGAVQVGALVLAQQVEPGAEDQLQAKLRQTLGRPVQLLLSQTPVHATETLDRQTIEDLIRQTAEKIPASHGDITARLSARFGVDTLAISSEPTTKTAIVRVHPETAEQFARIHKIAIRTLQDFPEWHIIVSPNIEHLPSLPFDENSARLNEIATQRLDDIIWVLRSANIGEVTVTGYDASTHTPHDARRIAQQRAETVRAHLVQAGFEAKAVAQYPVPEQMRQEREFGRAAMRRVDIGLVPKPTYTPMAE